MSDCYTPTDGEVLEAWATHNTPDLPTALDLVGAYDAFKRWLAEHDAKVRSETLRNFADSIPGDIDDPRDVADLARGVADHIEKSESEAREVFEDWLAEQADREVERRGN